MDEEQNEELNAEAMSTMLEELEANFKEDNLEEDSMEVKKEKNFILIRGKLSYGRINIDYGLFVILINKVTGGFLKFNLAFSRKDEVAYIKPDSKAFKRVFSKLGDKEKFEGRDLKLYLIDNLSKNEVFLIIDSVKNDDLYEIENIFQDKIEDFIREPIDLELYIEEKTEDEVRRMYPNLIIDNDIDIQNESMWNDVTEVNSSPVIDPFEGKKISKLTEGDEILVEINDEIFDKYQDKLHQFFIDSNEKKLVGVIKNIEFDDKIKSYDIFLQLGSKLYSRLIIEAEMELKLAVPKLTISNNQDEENQDLEEDKSQEDEDNNEVIEESIDIDNKVKEDIEEEIKEEIEKEVRNNIEKDLRTELKKEVREEIKAEVDDIKNKLIFVGFIGIITIISVIIIFVF